MLGLGLNLGLGRSGASLYALPANFSASLGYNIFKAGRKYHTSFDWTTNANPTGTTYYVSEENGDNSNDGLTVETAFRDIDHALGLFTVTGGTIFLTDKYYYRQNFQPGTYSPAGAIAIKSARSGGAPAYVTRAERFSALTWTQNGTYSDVWQATRSISALCVDATQTDEDGQIPLMDLQTSIANVDANPGSYYINGNIVYVRTADSREPDEDVLVMLDQSHVVIDADINIYIENVYFWGGNSNALQLDAGAGANTGIVVLNNVRGDFTSGGDGIFIENFAKAYLNGCVTSYNKNDGFNYEADTQLPVVLEYNCRAYQNGQEASADNNNSSTTHDGCKIVRLNGIYKSSQGPNIADTDAATAGTESLNLGIKVIGSRTATAEGAADACIYVASGAESYNQDCTLSEAYYGFSNVNSTLVDLGGNINTTAGGTNGTIT